MIKNIIERIINIISIVLIVFAAVVLLSVVFAKGGEVPSVFGYSSFRVVSGSMEPTIHTGSMIITKATPLEDIKVSDVITFYSSDPELGGAVNTHRVADIKVENGEYTFTTKGDANSVYDKYTVNGKEVLGVMKFSSSFVGGLLGLITKPYVFILIIVIPLLLMLGTNLYKTFKAAKSVADGDSPEK